MATRKSTGRNHRSADAVADHFLVKIKVGAGDTISNLKMQKLCYLAQGWSLALLGRPLFDDAIQAWGQGPAIPPLFRRFKPYRWGALDAYKLRTNPDKKLDAEELELLDWIWKKYGRYSGSELRDLTRGQAPWKEAYGDTRPPRRSEEEITHGSMKAYFLTQESKSYERMKSKVALPLLAREQIAQAKAAARAAERERREAERAAARARAAEERAAARMAA